MKATWRVILRVFACVLMLLSVGQSEAPDNNRSPSPDDPDQWKLYVEFGEPVNPLYKGDSAKGLLKVCGRVRNCDKLKKDPSIAAKICEKTKNCLEPCTQKRLYNLCVAQRIVHSFQGQIATKWRWIIILVLQSLTCVCGSYLWWKGHFKCVNLPVVGNKLVDKPTGGIKYTHYMWMRWIILGNTNTHWETHMKADSFVYEWTPLAETEWNPPAVPAEELEPQDSDHPYWNIATLREEMKDQDAAAQLQEYWTRIYSWAWIRYRAKGTKVKLTKDYKEQNVPAGAKPSFIINAASLKQSDSELTTTSETAEVG